MNADMLNRGTEDRPPPSLSLLGGGGGRTSPPPPLDPPLSLNIFYLHTSCKWDWTQVITTLVKSFPFYKDINKK